MCKLDYKESWVMNWCFWTVVLKKTLESPLECKAIQPVSPKGNQSWIFIGRTDAEAETLILCTWCEELTHLNAGKDWRQEKGTTEGKMVGWHHQLLELTQTHVHWVDNAIQPSHPLSSPSPPAFSLSQHQGLFQGVRSLHQVVIVLEFQLQYQSFQWLFRIYFH